MIEFDAETARAMEAMYLTPDVVGQRMRFLEALALRSGEQVLDVGSGPGLLAWDMARMVGKTGAVTGIDASEAMVAMAARRCAGLPAAFLAGSATQLALPDDSVDVVTSTQVYEYVAAMDQALAEAFRVLRPGGRLAILDTDWASVVWRTQDRKRMARVLRAWDDHLADPHLPARLGPLMEAAGFRITRREVIPLFNPGFSRHSYSAGILKGIKGFVLERGAALGVAPEETRAWSDEQYELARTGDYFFSINRYLFMGQKP